MEGDTIISRARELEFLDKQIVQAFLENDASRLIAAVENYLDLKWEIKKDLLEKPIISVSDVKASKVLSNIYRKNGMSSEQIVTAYFDEHSEIYRLSTSEIRDIGSDIFYSWFSHYEYIERLAELRPLVLIQNPSKYAISLLQTARQCFVFEQYIAAYGMLRALLEACARDICVKRGLIRSRGPNVHDLDPDKWIDLKRNVSNGSRDLERRLGALYRRFSVVVHGRGEVSREEALDSYEATLVMVEDLYEHNNVAT